jgi:hypothetical protein
VLVLGVNVVLAEPPGKTPSIINGFSRLQISPEKDTSLLSPETRYAAPPVLAVSSSFALPRLDVAVRRMVADLPVSPGAVYVNVPGVVASEVGSIDSVPVRAA